MPLDGKDKTDDFSRMVTTGRLGNGAVVIYTSIFGGYDDLSTPPLRLGYDFVCFTDDPTLRSDVWDVRVVGSEGNDGRTQNRFFKMQPHKCFPDHTVSIYIDGNVRLKNDPGPLIADIASKKLIIPPHPYRGCVYDEVLHCAAKGLVSQQLQEFWLEQFCVLGVPKSAGLFENNILVRAHHHPDVVLLMDAWWHLYLKKGGRDQLGLVPLAFQQGTKIYPMANGPRVSHKFFELLPHRVSRKGGRLTPLQRLTWLEHYAQINAGVSTWYVILHRILAFVMPRLLYILSNISVFIKRRFGCKAKP